MLELTIAGGVAVAWTIIAAPVAIVIGRVARERDAHV